jgi:hypothetical protein
LLRARKAGAAPPGGTLLDEAGEERIGSARFLAEVSAGLLCHAELIAWYSMGFLVSELSSEAKS